MLVSYRPRNHRSARLMPVCSRRARYRPRLEVLEQRLAPAGILNGNFAISDPANPLFGYTLKGNASIAGGEGILNEGTTTQTEITQTFTIAPGTTALKFTITGLNLISNGSQGAQDAFEAALLDPTTQAPLVGPPTGVPSTDSFLNIQQSGRVFFAPGVTVPGVANSGDAVSLSLPTTVTVDVSSLPANTQAEIFFDLIGFSPVTSSIRIDNLVAVNQTGVAPLTLEVDPASVTGPPGSGLTRLGTVTFDGTTNPGQPVNLTVNGGGSQSTTADGAGVFQFTNVALSEGPNTVDVHATNGSGTSTATTNVVHDDLSPDAALVSPVAGSTITTDPGFVDIQWHDVGAAGLDPASFSATNVTVTGVTVTQAEDRGGGLVRYHYSGTLPTGRITVARVAGSVADVAGNTNTAGSDSFIANLQSAPPPTAASDAFSTLQGTAIHVDAPGILSNDTGTGLIAVLVSKPSHGTLTLNADGSLVYAPDLAFAGTDSFVYKANNGLLDSENTSVTITITAVAPTAKDDTFVTHQATALHIAAPGVLANDTGTNLTATLATQTRHGTVTLGPDGSFVYLPQPSFAGTDSFTYRANNGFLDSPDATVTITVTPQQTPPNIPTATNKSFSAVVETPLVVPAPGVLAGDTGANLTAVLAAPAQHGTLTLSADGSFVYTANAGFCGTDSFSYKATNGTNSSAAATVTIQVSMGPPDLSVLTPFARYAYARHNLNPRRFDHYHPQPGPLFDALQANERPHTTYFENLARRQSAHAQSFNRSHPHLASVIRVLLTRC